MNDQEVFYPGSNLYHVTCVRESAVKKEGGQTWEMDQKDVRHAYVMASSVESASLKAAAYFNNKQGGVTFVANDVSMMASSDSEDNVFIG